MATRRFAGATEVEMSFLLNLVGFVAFIAGAAWVATIAGLSQTLIVPVAGVLLALAVVASISRGRVDPA